MINNNFERAIEAGDDERSALIAQAEFLMRELDRRHDSWVSLRDFILDIVVIALIGWEIHMSYRAESLQTENFKQEKEVFENLDKSSAATASTLKALSDTTQTMNKAIQSTAGA
jgi:Tfp pilus assembly protein PilO